MNAWHVVVPLLEGQVSVRTNDAKSFDALCELYRSASLFSISLALNEMSFS